MTSRNYAAYLLGLKSYSESDIYEKLIKKGYEHDDVVETIAYMRDIGAVNDDEYARNYANSLKRRGYGREKIRHSLYVKGIDRDIITLVLRQMAFETEILKASIDKKLKGDLSDKDKIRKVAQSLYRKGFSFSEINEAMREYSLEMEQENVD